jgi:putative peptidoglycan lipid II flippase
MTTVGGHTLLSRILGYMRDAITLHILGAGSMSDALFMATKIPSLFRRLFAEGAFNAAFIPVFAGILSTDGKEKAKKFAENAFAGLAIVLFIFVIVSEIFMPYIVGALASGFKGDPEKMAWTIQYTRITFPYIFFISLTALLGGVLNSIDYFAAPAATQSIANIVVITSFVGLSNITGTPGEAAAWGSCFSGVIQCIWLYWIAGRAGMHLEIVRPKMDDSMRAFLSKMLPGILGTGVVQINLFLDLAIGSWLPSGGITYLQSADRVNQFPLSIIGVAMGTALLPLLSKQIRGGDLDAAQKTQKQAVSVTLMLTIPAMVALMIYADSFVALLFKHGNFTIEHVRKTAQSLSAFGIGLPAYVLVKVLSSAFFAYGDTKTPVKVAAYCLFINVLVGVLSIIYLRDYNLGHVGIACGLSVSSWINAFMLMVLLRRKKLISLCVFNCMPKILLSTAVMGMVIFIIEPYFSPLLIDGSFMHKMGTFLTLVFVGAGTFAAVKMFFK